jgi:plastocyanin
MKTYITLGILIIIIGSIFLLGKNPTPPETASNDISTTTPGDLLPVPNGETASGTATTTSGTNGDEDGGDEAKTVQITYTDAGFSPTRVEINKGDTVTFVNESPRDMWVASARHPSHTVYPGTDVTKCGKVGADKMFDACKGVEPEGEWSYTFTNTGEWNYHDHLNASKFGTVVVK